MFAILYALGMFVADLFKSPLVRVTISLRLLRAVLDNPSPTAAKKGWDIPASLHPARICHAKRLDHGVQSRARV